MKKMKNAVLRKLGLRSSALGCGGRGYPNSWRWVMYHHM